MADIMDKPLVIRPRLWLLVAAIAASALAPVALSFTPNPFEGLALGERPPRLFMALWLLLPVIMLLSLWRLATWTNYRATADTLEARGAFGRRRHAWSDLAAAELDTPVGMPPAYELRFGKRKIRFIAAHHDRATIRALKVYIAR